MANTVMTAKNSWAEGLVMDFAPDNTQATTLTSALNATLLTFNGNEMSLLNDMGNGRVETAYLPEGYIPVGTCEFGDIIYIVSYNPLINKSLIGCFPSPERNISSEELGGMNQSLRWTDFLVNLYGSPSGELVASSVKKVLYGSKDMTSGDKYIVYSGELDYAENNKYLSDYKNTSHQHNRFPKLVKIHIVSIEESGKITYLDSSTKWYKENDYYLQNKKNIVDKPDLDSYRTMVSSAYSIFSSKVSGKLALLVELEKITGFNCTWNACTKEVMGSTNLLSNNYSIYWNFSWETNNFNINPSATVLTRSKWSGEDSTHAGLYQTWEKYDKGWMLGGKDKNWSAKMEVPIAYPNPNYNYQTISRVYTPENYSGTFDEFIKEGSFEALTKSQLALTKNTLGLTDVELIKTNIARKAEGVPDVGKYYFNCSTSTVGKDGNTTYYTNYNNALKPITAQPMSDDIINNTFNYPVIKHFSDFIIPIKLKITEDGVEEWKNVNINNLIYNYELTPAMPYGLLRELSLDGYIDFKKIGTKSIELNSWKYFNYENTSTLTWGLEAYTEPNKGISEVVFIFYDNQGPTAAYHNSGKTSYNGKFTEYFTLNTSGTNYKLNNKNEKGDTFYHKGEAITKDSAIISNTYITEDGKIISIKDMVDGVTYYLDDAGTIYSNCLYLVKTIVKYCSIGALDLYIEDEVNYIENYRWYWTNTMFNDYYYSVLDFKELKFNLNLDCLAIFDTAKDKWEVGVGDYSAKNKYDTSIISSNAYKSLSATVLYVNQDGKLNDNIKMAVKAGLLYDYNTFNIEKDKIDKIKARIFLAKEYLNNSPEQPVVKFSEGETTVLPNIYPTEAVKLSGKVDTTTSPTLNTLVGSDIVGIGEELNASMSSYEKYTNNMHIDSTKKAPIKTGNSGKNLVYIDSNGQEEILTDYELYDTTLDKILYNEDKQIIDVFYPLTFSGIHYSKYYYLTKISTTPTKILTSFVQNTVDLKKYAMSPNGPSQIQYNKIILISHNDEKNGNSRITGGLASFTGNTLSSYINIAWYQSEDLENISILSFLLLYYDLVNTNFKFLFPLGYGHTTYGVSRCPATKSTNNVEYALNKFLESTAFSDFDLGGTLTGITSSGTIEPGDHHDAIEGSWNALTKFVPITLGYLTLLYYLSEADETLSLYYPDNYVFLDKNYTSYKRDVVIELSSSLDDDNDLLIILKKWKYKSYLELVVNNLTLSEELKTKLKKENNISLKLQACLRTAPIELLFNYITPSIDSVEVLTKTIVKSIYTDVPSLTSQSFLSNYIYVYDQNSKSFKSIRNTTSLYKVKKYTINDESIISTLSNNKETFGISQMNNLLEIKDDTLSILSIPISSGKYKMKTANHEGGRNLVDYKSNLTYFT